MLELTTIYFVLFQSGAVATAWHRAMAFKWYIQARLAGQPAREILERVIGPSGSRFAN